MPRAKSGQSQSGSTHGASKRVKAKFAGYVNYVPTTEDKQGLKSMLESGHDPASDLSDIIESGYKLGLTFDSSGAAFIATLFAENPELSHAGYILSARAGDGYDAIRRVCYLHLYVLECRWLERMETDSYDSW